MTVSENFVREMEYRLVLIRDQFTFQSFKWIKYTDSEWIPYKDLVTWYRGTKHISNGGF